MMHWTSLCRFPLIYGDQDWRPEDDLPELASSLNCKRASSLVCIQAGDTHPAGIHSCLDKMSKPFSKHPLFHPVLCKRYNAVMLSCLGRMSVGILCSTQCCVRNISPTFFYKIFNRYKVSAE